jgi:hypothetical protein
LIEHVVTAESERVASEGEYHPLSEGAFSSPSSLVLFPILGFNPIRKSAFRDKNLPTDSTNTAVKAIVVRSKDKGPNSSLCEGRITRSELPNGDEIVHAYGRLRWFGVISHSLNSFRIYKAAPLLLFPGVNTTSEKKNIVNGVRAYGGMGSTHWKYV